MFEHFAEWWRVYICKQFLSSPKISHNQARGGQMHHGKTTHKLYSSSLLLCTTAHYYEGLEGTHSLFMLPFKAAQDFTVKASTLQIIVKLCPTFPPHTKKRASLTVASYSWPPLHKCQVSLPWMRTPCGQSCNHEARPHTGWAVSRTRYWVSRQGDRSWPSRGPLGGSRRGASLGKPCTGLRSGSPRRCSAPACGRCSPL